VRSGEALRGAEPVTLQEMLDARERRAATQRDILCRERKPLISFTLNLPGPYKDFPLARDAFLEGKRLIGLTLKAGGHEVSYQFEQGGKTGSEVFFAVDAPADVLKRLVVPLEEYHELGRLFDIDVFDAEGAQMHRQTLGYPARKCLVCDKPALICARGRSHSQEELLGRVTGVLRDYDDSRYADQISQAALRAVMTEVCITPKPGLVDRKNSGSHRDMDIFSFIDSGASLVAFFRRTTLCALRFEKGPERLLESVRFLGLDAEGGMYRITGGVNTHKGAIFTMGILCAAAGCLRGRGEELSENTLFETCARIAGGARCEFAPDISQGGAAVTYGASTSLRYDLTGARGEAAAGLPHVQKALKVLKMRLGQGDSLEQAGVATLMHLMAWVDDTNVVSRSDMGTLRALQAEVRESAFGESDPLRLMEYAARLDQKLIERNISPGGCADLLGATLMVYDILALS